MVAIAAPDPKTDLPMWVIYDHPSDYPSSFVVRRQWAGNGKVFADAKCFLCQSLEAARAVVPPGLHCIARDPADDPVIVETWL